MSASSLTLPLQLSGYGRGICLAGSPIERVRVLHYAFPPL